MPPLRFAFGADPSLRVRRRPAAAHALIAEVAASVAAAGFRRIAIVNSSPWSEELCSAAARDLRVSRGLHMFHVHLSALDLDFHPVRSRSRRRLQTLLTALCGSEPEARRAAGRPGPAPATWGDESVAAARRDAPARSAEARTEGAAILAAAAGRLAKLISDIHDRPPLSARLTPRMTFPSYRDRYLPAMTLRRIRALPDKAWAPVILATGAIEQHGPHLPVAVDALMGQVWLSLALARLPAGASCYVAPPITIGKSNEHTGFPGTLMISRDTLRSQILAVARQAQAWGFRSIAVINTHGGNVPVLVPDAPGDPRALRAAGRASSSPGP